MKIFICTSKRFYNQVADIIEILERLGHQVTPPNGYNDPNSEGLIQQLDKKVFVRWKADMIRKNGELVSNSDAILVLNKTDGNQKNYIGGAAFLEIFKAFELGKKIFLYNEIPHSNFTDELTGMSPIVLNGNLTLIK